MTQDEKLDEALKETFPASDPFHLSPDVERGGAAGMLVAAAPGVRRSMPRAIDSASSQHKLAATKHELAASQHRKAAAGFDQEKWRAAGLASEGAMQCAENAHEQSIRAAKRSKQPE